MPLGMYLGLSSLRRFDLHGCSNLLVLVLRVAKKSLCFRVRSVKMSEIMYITNISEINHTQYPPHDRDSANIAGIIGDLARLHGSPIGIDQGARPRLSSDFLPGGIGCLFLHASTGGVNVGIMCSPT
jgi:hypothetical protein